MTAEIPDWMIIDAVRYAVGRTSYQTGVTSDWLVAHWQDIPDHVRAIIRRDLENEFRMDDDCRKRIETGERQPGGLPLGWDCDREVWERVRKLWGGAT